MWDIIILIPDHCLSIYFKKKRRKSFTKTVAELAQQWSRCSYTLHSVSSRIQLFKLSLNRASSF